MEVYFQAIFEETDEAYYICDFEGKILQANQSAVNLLGKPQADINKKLLSDLKIRSRTGISLTKHQKNFFWKKKMNQN